MLNQNRSPREIARAISLSRRNFLRAATGATAFTALPALRAMRPAPGRKVVVVTFGGGARDDETFMPDGQENIPHLLGELIPQATFFTQVVNRGILGHYVANASLATGAYETFNNFAAVPPEHPTVFEYFRKDLRRPATDAGGCIQGLDFESCAQASFRRKESLLKTRAKSSRFVPQASRRDWYAAQSKETGPTS